MNLTTVARVKILLNMETTEYDEALSMLVGSCSREAEIEMGREAEVASRTKYFDTDSLTYVYRLDAWPVTSVTSIKYDADSTFTGSEETFANGDEYALIRNGEMGEIYIYPRLGKHPSSLQVIYTAGMASNTDAFIAAFPDISAAVTEQVAYEFQQRNQLGLNSIASASASVSTFAPLNLLPKVKRIYSRYQRV